jgi:flagellar motor switch protein FliN/FliY
MADRGIGFLQDIPVEVTVELGRARMTIRELAALDRGDVVQLDRADGDPVDLVAGGRVIARAELVTVGDRVALRVVEVAGENGLRSVG